MSSVLNDNNMIAVLDIGTSKTACVLAYPDGDDKAVIIGAGSFQNTGVKKSEIVEINPVIEAVRSSSRH